jgi:hypothetical protein
MGLLAGFAPVGLFELLIILALPLIAFVFLACRHGATGRCLPI